jgi:hypothetical protein
MSRLVVGPYSYTAIHVACFTGAKDRAGLPENAASRGAAATRFVRQARIGEAAAPVRFSSNGFV